MERISTIESVLTPEERNQYASDLTYWIVLTLTLALWGLPVAGFVYAFSLPADKRWNEALVPLSITGLILAFEVAWRRAHLKVLREVLQQNIIGWYRFSHRCTSAGTIVSEFRVGRKKYRFDCCPDSPRIVEPCGGLFPKGEVIWYAGSNAAKVIGTITFFRPTIHLITRDSRGYMLYELIDERKQRGQYASLQQLLAHIGTVSG